MGNVRTHRQTPFPTNRKIPQKTAHFWHFSDSLRTGIRNSRRSFSRVRIGGNNIGDQISWNVRSSVVGVDCRPHFRQTEKVRKTALLWGGFAGRGRTYVTGPRSCVVRCQVCRHHAGGLLACNMSLPTHGARAFRRDDEKRFWRQTGVGAVYAGTVRAGSGDMGFQCHWDVLGRLYTIST